MSTANRWAGASPRRSSWPTTRPAAHLTHTRPDERSPEVGPEPVGYSASARQVSLRFPAIPPRESANPSACGRTDGKSSLLLAFNGAVLAGLASVADEDLPTATKVFGALAVLALGAAAVLMLLVVRPRLRGDDQASFPQRARLDEDEIRACMDGDTRAARIRVLSALAVRKFIHLRRAVDLSLAALALLALAAAGLAL
ncbi:Pycsar system effector family protein [Streptomyces mirabilis]|uniref:Pycsar system effector family protein n=1 Tax=Streptomyces mirabilis TaxID=68239 RepID=UPI0036E217C6